ncbi:transporter [bacterium]|nr:transporter [bacterium]
MLKRGIWVVAAVMIILIGFAGLTSAQTATDKVRLFQSYLLDTPISKTNHVQPGLNYGSYDGFSITEVGAHGGYGLNEDIELLGKINFVNFSVDGGDGESGLSDLTVVARYKLSENKENAFSAGGLITLPFGKEEIGYGNMNFGGYAAVRHSLKKGMVVTGNFAMMFVEQGDDRDTSMEISSGLIYPKDKKMNIVGEFVIKSDYDYMMISCGVDYLMKSGARLRGALGLGLDDGAPDMAITAGYLMTL